MIVEFNLSPSDYVAFSLYHNAHDPGIQKNMRTWRFGLPVLWLAIMLLPVALFGGPFSSGNIVWLVGAVLWFAFVPSLLRWSVRRNAARYYQRGLANGQIGLHRFELTDTGIRDSTPVSDLHVAWAAVDRIAEGEEHLFVYVGPHAAHILPKAALGDRLDTFRDVIAQRSAKAGPV